jgi:thioredoxin reductase
MAGVDERPFPPGYYPVVIVGTGPGGLQTSYSLHRLGVAHALLSSDDAPGGMFRRFPLFQRLITWTKPYSIEDPRSRRYERYDWNSLVAEEPESRALVRAAMHAAESYFPTRAEMEAGVVSFVGATGTAARYGCTWESTRRDDDGRFTVTTSDGEYQCDVLVVAVGMTQAWKPSIPGMDEVPHYVDVRSASDYADKRVFVVGKRNSGYEIGNALLPYARRVVLGSPRPSRISVVLRTTAAARARYLQPYEDHVLGGGHFVIDAAITRMERTATGWNVHTAGTTHPGERVFDVDEVVAATGFTTPLRDLRELGVATFSQDRLPSQTPMWESRSVPGIFFAGSITQGSIGLKKHGIPSNSAAVHGFRYNARVLAAHLAERFGRRVEREAWDREHLVDRLLEEVTFAPELWNQQAYLARVIRFGGPDGLVNEGIQPLAAFVDASGSDAVAATVETGPEGDIHPTFYLRANGRVAEHALPPDLMHDFRGEEQRRQLSSILKGVRVS